VRSGANGDVAAGEAASLSAYEETVSAALEANRGLLEAYWKLRTIAEQAAEMGVPPQLPSHQELLEQALVQPGTGRRAVMSELEKALVRDKERLQEQLKLTRDSSGEQLKRVENQLAGRFKGKLDTDRERERLIEETREAKAHAEAMELRAKTLQQTVDAYAQQKNEMTDQGEALQKLHAADAALVSEQEFDVKRIKHRLTEVERQNAELTSQLEEARLARSPAFEVAAGDKGRGKGRGGSYSDAQVSALQVQVRQLTFTQAELERERSELKRRSTSAEQQLEEMQSYLASNISKYQKEILRLRQALTKSGVQA